MIACSLLYRGPLLGVHPVRNMRDQSLPDTFSLVGGQRLGIKAVYVWKEENEEFAERGETPWPSWSRPDDVWGEAMSDAP